MPGANIVVGTNHGCYAKIRPHHNSLVLISTSSDGKVHGPVVIPMQKNDLLERARSGDFFSYAAGVAYSGVQDFDKITKCRDWS